jgi:predicted permease
MDILSGILKTIIPVILLLAIGMICKRKNLIQKSAIDGLKFLVVNICLPAVLFSAFYKAAFSVDIVIITITMFLLCCAVLGLGFLFKKAFRFQARTMPFLMSGFEAGMLGYALYTLLFGADAITSFATVDLGQVLFVFTVYIVLLRKNSGGTLKSSLAAMIKSPVIIAVLAGVVIGAAGLGHMLSQTGAGEVVQYTLDLIKAPTAVLILLVVGYEIGFAKSNIRSILSVVFLRLITMGILCAAIILSIGPVIHMSKTILWAFILMFLLPPPFVLPVYVESEDENAFITSTLSVYTVLALIGFIVIAALVS